MKISLIAGARPNFIKIAPLIHAIKAAQSQGIDVEYRLVHTGQHYDEKLSKVFFTQLDIPEPNVNLGAGSGTQAEQTARIMVEFEKDLTMNPVDLVIVVGDVTSTLACTIVAKKMLIKVAHVEGGIRSFDMTMPEEVNRMVTDSISDFFFTTSEVANENLRRQGISEDRIFFVGNTMIDTLLAHLSNTVQPELWKSENLSAGKYYTLTLHRPSNVDDIARLGEILATLDAEVDGKVIFPVHPRTAKNLSRISAKYRNIVTTPPLSYHEFIYLIRSSKAVITDSGGVQEETTVLGVPCITLRKNTERPETVSLGTNDLIGEEMPNLIRALAHLKRGEWKKGTIPPLWDGKTARRIIEILPTLNTRAL